MMATPLLSIAAMNKFMTASPTYTSIRKAKERAFELLLHTTRTDDDDACFMHFVSLARFVRPFRLTSNLHKPCGLYSLSCWHLSSGWSE